MDLMHGPRSRKLGVPVPPASPDATSNASPDAPSDASPNAKVNLKVGDIVEVQHYFSRQWTEVGKITEVNRSGKSFKVDVGNKVRHRSFKQLRKLADYTPSYADKLKQNQK